MDKFAEPKIFFGTIFKLIIAKARQTEQQIPYFAFFK